MSTSQVYIGQYAYDVYGNTADADQYWFPLNNILESGTSWSLASADARASSLVAATRIIDSLGYPTLYGTFSLRNAIADFDTICYEIAGQVLLQPAVFTQLSSGSNIRRVDAGGGVVVEFFNETLTTTSRFSPLVDALLAKYLGNDVVSTSQSWASGTGDSPDAGGNSYNYSLTRPT